VNRRQLLLSAISPIVLGAFADDPIDFDARAGVRILEWIVSGAAGDPPDWREEPAYRLAREQAQWSGQPNPDLEVERAMRSATRESARASSTWVREILAGRERFLSEALPQLHAYLPAATRMRGSVALAAFLPNYAFSMNYTIVVSVTDRFWENRTDRLFNLLVHELFHNGYIQHRQGTSPGDAVTGAALADAFLWQVRNEGLATYVAWRARPASLQLQDYRLLDDALELSSRFERLRAFLRDCRAATGADLPQLRTRFWDECSRNRVPYITGAAMARRIEETTSRSALVRTIETGPQSFAEAYQATKPPYSAAA
jgi:hypothetical protein